MVKITWTSKDLEGQERETEIAGPAPHDGESASEHVARFIYLAEMARIPGWAGFDAGTGPVIRITAPEEYSGDFAVSVSQAQRDGRLIYGTSARKVAIRSEAEVNQHLHVIALSTPADVVDTAYEFLGNIYGHDIFGATNAEESVQIEKLEDLYERAILHDRGWPVRCKGSGRIGFLAVTDFPVTQEQARAFFRVQGVTPQAVSQWLGESHDWTVCFIPMARIDEAQALMSSLEALAPSPAPSV